MTGNRKVCCMCMAAFLAVAGIARAESAAGRTDGAGTSTTTVLYDNGVVSTLDVLAAHGPIAPQASGAGPEGTPIVCNGEYITGMDNGSGGADTSAIEAGHTGFGFNWNAVAGAPGPFRVADDFTVPPGNTWTLNEVKWLGYQTGSSTTSTFTSVRIQVWQGGPPGVGTLVFGDTTTNRH